jgi:hypothetical protein
MTLVEALIIAVTTSLLTCMGSYILMERSNRNEKNQIFTKLLEKLARQVQRAEEAFDDLANSLLEYSKMQTTDDESERIAIEKRGICTTKIDVYKNEIQTLCNESAICVFRINSFDFNAELHSKMLSYISQCERIKSMVTTSNTYEEFQLLMVDHSNCLHELKIVYMTELAKYN